MTVSNPANPIFFGFGGALLRRGKGKRSSESARLPPMCPGFDSRTQRHMWVEFIVGSLLCSERFFSGYSGFSLFSKTSCNISKLQFDQDYCQALPVFDIKFAFTFTFFYIAPAEVKQHCRCTLSTIVALVGQGTRVIAKSHSDFTI